MTSKKFEDFKKIQKIIDTTKFQEYAISVLKEYIDKNCANIKDLDIGDKNIFLNDWNFR
jgi:geranylgeranyl pyrophosphate synthase